MKALSHACAFFLGICSSVVLAASLNLAPATGRPGDKIYLGGPDLGKVVKVYFCCGSAPSVAVQLESRTNKKYVIVPYFSGLSSGAVKYELRGNTTKKPGAVFTLGASPQSAPAVAAPLITSIVPVSGPAGSTVALHGTHLTPGRVWLGEWESSSVTPTATGLDVVVPPNAVGSANFRVVTPGGSNIYVVRSFTVTTPSPTITSITPLSGPVGTTVQILGTHFVNPTVTLNGTSLTPASLTVSSMSVTIPEGASSGRFVIQTAGGTATSSGNFTVNVPYVAPDCVRLPGKAPHYAGTLASGNMSLTLPLGLSFQSLARNLDRHMGLGWVLPYDSFITMSGSQLKLVDSDLTTTLFLFDTDSNRWTSSDSVGWIVAEGTGYRVNHPDGNSLLYKSFGSSLLPFQAKDTLGNTITYNRDSAGYLLDVQSSLSPAIPSLTLAYSNNLVSAATVPGGFVYAFSYSGGRLARFTLPDGSSYQFSYNSLGQLTKSQYQDEISEVKYFTSGPGNGLVQWIGAPYHEEGYEYSFDSNDKLSSVMKTSRGQGRTSVYKENYNDKCYLTSIEVDGKRTQFERDDRGNATAITDPFGLRNLYEFDSRNRVTKHTDATNKQITFTYHSNGILKTSTGLGLTQEYDVGGRLISSTGPSNGVQIARNTAGLPSSVKIGGVTRKTLTYTAQGLPATVTADGLTKSFSYNAQNQLTGVSDPLGRTTTFATAANLRSVTVTSPSGASTTSNVDNLGLSGSSCVANGTEQVCSTWQRTLGTNTAARRKTQKTKQAGMAPAIARQVLNLLEGAQAETISEAKTTVNDGLGNTFVCYDDGRKRVNGIDTAGPCETCKKRTPSPSGTPSP